RAAVPRRRGPGGRARAAPPPRPRPPADHVLLVATRHRAARRPVPRRRRSGPALLPGPRVVARRAPRRLDLAPGIPGRALVLLSAAVLVAAAATSPLSGLPR